MLSNLKIRTCLITVIGFLTVLLTGLGALGLYSLQSTNDALQSMYANRLTAMAQLSRVMVALDLSKSGIASAILDPANVDAELQKLEQALKKGEAAWKVYAATQLTEQEQTLAGRFFTEYGKLQKDGVLPAMEAMRNFNVPGATELYSQNLVPLYQSAHTPMTQLMQVQQEVGEQIYAQSQQRYRIIMSTSVTAMALGLLFAVAMGVLLVRAISRPLANAVKIAQSVADGDLTQHIEVRSTNETGQLMHALKTMNGNLLHIVGKVRTGTETIAAASTQIAAGNQDLSGRTEQQAASLEETASSMEQLTGTVQQNAEHARQANQLVIAAAEVAAQGGDVVAQVVDTMGAIDASSRRIVDIISVIDSIAFQTNILALNAAVEAARAGEQGRGFAVVASEVRGLAQRSASAAKEIKTLIDTSVGKISDGSKLVEKAGVTMRQVVDSVNRVTTIVGAIADASHEQRHGIEQVNQAITQMDETTQHNAALVEEAAAAAQALREQAAQLSEVVGVFRLNQVDTSG